MNKPTEDGIFIVPEDLCRELVSAKDAFHAVEQVFASMSNGDAYNFPVIREAIGHCDALYGFKSGFDRAGLALGMKAGGYWPQNHKQDLTNHQSTVFLFDPDTGRCKALVGGNYLTAVRTAAACAVSIAHLARPESSTLGIVGAGHQTTFQLRAAAQAGNFTQVLAWNRTPERLTSLAETAEELGIPFASVSREELCERSDVIITMTAAHEALLQSEWVTPGTHIACMGTDTKGKQEVDPAIMVRARVFTDEVAQSISIGETQHAVAQGLIQLDDITPIGEVINGTAKGRQDASDITLFDSTGVGLQDLAVASAALRLAIADGSAQRVEL